MAKFEDAQKASFIKLLNALHGFIRNARELRDELRKLAMKPEPPNNLTAIAWSRFGRIYNSYRSAWILLGDVHEILRARWGQAQLWIDQSRASLYRFNMQIIWHDGITDGHEVQVGFCNLEALDCDQEEYNQKQVKEIQKEFKQNAGKARAFDIEAHNERLAKHSDFLDQQESGMNEWIVQLANHDFVYQAFQYTRDSGWEQKFGSLLDPIEFMLATLTVIWSHGKPIDFGAEKSKNIAPGIGAKELGDAYGDIEKAISDSKKPLRTIDEVAIATGLYQPDSHFRERMAMLRRLKLIDKVGGEYVCVKKS